ncbi:MAG: acyloxyacyl hydrolase [Phycisphaeraceae bacterium]|nr:acyloxyacyl hydrolase [Phycisphaeraceae bacterium]
MTRLLDGLNAHTLRCWPMARTSTSRPSRCPAWRVALAGLGLGIPGRALSDETERVPWAALAQDRAAFLDDTPPARAEFGAKGSQWLTAGVGGASDFDEAEDAYGFVAWSLFLDQDVEWIVEGGGWALDQPGDVVAGASLSTIFRWHFLHRGPWTVFGDAGIGVLLSADKVPVEGSLDGTNVNFLPRLGAGATYELDPGGARLIVGLRWHHISNARILGDDDNPGRDSAMVYVGLTWPF